MMLAGVFLALSLGTSFGGAPDDRCASLADKLDASVEISTLEIVEQKGDLPSFCRIGGTIAPSIGFEARLPLENWNRKYFQAGCGGFCGVVLADKDGRSNTINPALRRGYAVLTTDGGHQAAHLGVAEWAFDNDVAEKMYADESIARAFKVGRALTKSFYRKKPKYAYFSGCSNGGRMAAIAAQRYPRMFDGIISGCPVLNLSRAGGVFGAWILQTNTDKSGDAILTEAFAAKIPLLERAVRAQCDGLDGVEDGLVAAPFECRVDNSEIPRCKAGEQASDCLSDDEARVVERWWRGPHNTAGEQLFGGIPEGSERFWPIWYLGSREAPRVGTMLADGYLRYLGFESDNPDRSASAFDFDRDVGLLESKGRLFNATDPDLSAFRDAGGKMIMWHGLADPLVIPDQSVNYYRSVVERMGSDAAVQEFYRLFLAPGLGHCWEATGAGPEDFDPLLSLENWVENGEAPDRIIASPSDDQKSLGLGRLILRPFPAMPEEDQKPQ